MTEDDYLKAIDAARRAPNAIEEAACYDEAARIASEVSQRMAQEAVKARYAAADCRNEDW